MYGKLFASTYTGSMFGMGPDVFAVWGYVIANVVDSSVELNPVLLAAAIGMPVDRVEAAIAKLGESDPKSRNPAADGRRLIHEHGFQYHVTSHNIYRNIRSNDERREYNREAQRKSRANRSLTVNDVNDGHSLSALSAKSESDTETDPRGTEDTVLRTRDPDPAGARAGAGAQARDHARSNGHAKAWSAWDWKVAYGLAWRERYQQNAYGMAGDSKACSTLKAILDELPEVERLSAQAIAPQMFAEFLASKDPETIRKRHPFAFFVGEWGGLRVPKRRAREPGGALQAPKLPDASEFE